MSLPGTATTRSYPPVYRAAPLLVAALALGGCSSHRPVDIPAVIAAPASYRDHPAAGSAAAPPAVPAPDPWWEAFGDPDLSRLIRRVFRDNLTLRAAWARLDATGAAVGVAAAARRATVDLNASAARNQIFFPGAGAIDLDRHAVSLPARYEVDLFGRLRDLEGAAGADRLAARADLETLALSLAAELAQTYFSWREAQTRRAVLLRQAAENDRLVTVLETRFTEGQGSSLDLYQQERLAKGTTAQVAAVRVDEVRLEYRLATLAGLAPGTLPLPGSGPLPTPPALPALGVPADLLQRRPDLRAAAARLAAADKRLGAAVKARLPRITLGTTLSYQVDSPARLFRDLLRAANADLALPVLDGGRRRAEARRGRADVTAAVEAYRAAFLAALEEVETARGQEDAQRDFLARLRDQETSARRALELAESRYQEGAEDFLRVLTARQAVQQVQLEIVRARARRLAFRVQLCRALGGSWTRRLSPGDRDPIPTRGPAPEGDRR